MRRRLLDVLVCPLDKVPLEVVPWEESRVALAPETLARIRRRGLDPALYEMCIETGVLLNRARRIFYPIHGGVPRMLAFPTGMTRSFAAVHRRRIGKELPGFHLPDERPFPGEGAVLRTFSSEWRGYGWDGRAYWNVDADTMYASMRFMLDLQSHPVADASVLEVGIGVGGIADHLARAEECELFGVDLSHAVDTAQKHFGANPFLHVVQSSLFRMPVREETFDLVYSHGVIHHTFSTRCAFESIGRLPRRPGGRLYVWVYSGENEYKSRLRAALMALEALVRPWCSALPERLQTLTLLPLVPAYIAHQNFRVWRRRAGLVSYGWREALHAARDRFTPPYAHRHSEAEVLRWFADAGFGDLGHARQRPVPAFVPESFLRATMVSGLRLPAAVPSSGWRQAASPVAPAVTDLRARQAPAP